MENDNNGWAWILILVILYLVFFHKQKFEGQTAEEWYYEYDYVEAEKANIEDEYQEFRSCVEDYAYSDDYEDLQQIYYSCL